MHNEIGRHSLAGSSPLLVGSHPQPTPTSFIVQHDVV